MKQREADGHLGNLGAGELFGDRGLHGWGWWATRAEICISEGNGRLVAITQIAVLETIVDHVGKFFGESLLPRDREAHVASIAAVGDARVAQANDFLRGLIKDAMTPELRVEREVFANEFGLMRQHSTERGDRFIER